MQYTTEELREATRQIDSLLHKLRATCRTLESKAEPQRYRSQITLAARRIRALEIAAERVAAAEAELSREGEQGN